jgi:hypothetical protein
MINLTKFHIARQNMDNKSLVFFFLKYPLRKFQTLLIKRKVMNSASRRDTFEAIYKRNYWGSEESRSGPGSSVLNTVSIRKELPKIFEKFEIYTVFDAPCGDFNWMKTIDLSGVDYTGADIVESMVDQLNMNYSGDKIRFLHMDLICEPFPKSDLVISRDCFFHLSYKDTIGFLKNFLESQSTYLLSTSHENNGLFENKDITTGDFRLIDLFAPPYGFSHETLFEIKEGSGDALPSRSLYLWNKFQVGESYRSLTSASKEA